MEPVLIDHRIGDTTATISRRSRGGDGCDTRELGDLRTVHQPDRYIAVRAVGATSAALWSRGGESPQNLPSRSIRSKCPPDARIWLIDNMKNARLSEDAMRIKTRLHQLF